MLIWKEGKKSRDKKRHSVIRENLRASNMPGNIREQTLVSVLSTRASRSEAAVGETPRKTRFCIVLCGHFRAWGCHPTAPGCPLSWPQRLKTELWGLCSIHRWSPLDLEEVTEQIFGMGSLFPASQPQACLC